MKYTFNAETRTHKWQLSCGNVTFTQPEIISDNPMALPALTLGFKTKIANGAALAHDKTTGKAATDREKMAGMQAVVDRLTAPEPQWNVGARGPQLVNVEALVSAILMTVEGKTEAAVRKYVEGCDEAKRRKLAESDQFRAEYAAAVARQRPVAADDEELLAEIEEI